MNKFLFIIPPSISLEEYKDVDKSSLWNQIFYPYGPLSIISYVNAELKNIVDFKVLDLRIPYYSNNDESKAADLIYNKAKDEIKNFKPNFIGVSACFNTCYLHLKNLDRAIKDSGSKAIVLLGGSCASNTYEEIFNEFPNVDMVLFSEGEIPIKNLLKTEKHFDAWKENPAIITREAIQAGQVPQSQFVQNLDEIPPLDLSYIDSNMYKSKEVNVVTSRGCPFNCIFCSLHLMVGKKIRYFSADRIIDDITKYYNQGYRKFNILDDNFLFNLDRAKKILSAMASMNIDGKMVVEFPSGVMVARVDEEIAKLMKSVGVVEVPLALESGSERVLKDIIQKPLTKSEFERAVQALKNEGVKTRIHIVSGLPGETDFDRKLTVEYLTEVGIDWASINLAVPLFGSRLYNLCKDEGYLKNCNDKIFKLGTAYIETPDFSAEGIKEAVYLMNLEVNFVNNYNIRIGNYQKALPYFVHLYEAYPEHAFVHYCMAKCYKGLNQVDKFEKHQAEFERLINTDSLWGKYANHFNLRQKICSGKVN